MIALPFTERNIIVFTILYWHNSNTSDIPAGAQGSPVGGRQVLKNPHEQPSPVPRWSLNSGPGFSGSLPNSIGIYSFRATSEHWNHPHPSEQATERSRYPRHIAKSWRSCCTSCLPESGLIKSEHRDLSRMTHSWLRSWKQLHHLGKGGYKCSKYLPK